MAEKCQGATLSSNQWATAVSGATLDRVENQGRQRRLKHSINSITRLDNAVRSSKEDPYSTASAQRESIQSRFRQPAVAEAVPKPSRLHSATNSLKLRKKIDPRTGLAASVAAGRVTARKVDARARP